MEQLFTTLPRKGMEEQTGNPSREEGKIMVLTNRQLAERLRERAHRLAQEGANVYRVRALRRAALVLLGLPYEAAQMATPQGRKLLAHIPGIGRGIARTIAEWVRLSQEIDGETAPTPGDTMVSSPCAALDRVPPDTCQAVSRVG